MQVFPKGSAMSADVSRAIVSLTEGGEMARIERKWFGDPGACDSQGSGGVGASSLCFWSFSGLFLITGVASGLSLVVYLTTLAYRERNELRAAEPAGAGSMSLRRLRAWLQHYDRKDTRSPSFKRRDDDGSVRRNVVDAKQQMNGEAKEEAAIRDIAAAPAVSPSGGIIGESDDVWGAASSEEEVAHVASTTSSELQMQEAAVLSREIDATSARYRLSSVVPEISVERRERE